MTRRKRGWRFLGDTHDRTVCNANAVARKIEALLFGRRIKFVLSESRFPFFPSTAT